MNGENLALKLIEISTYMEQFPRENIYALSHLAESTSTPGTHTYIYKNSEEIVGAQIILPNGRWFPYFTSEETIPHLIRDARRHKLRWIGAMRSITDPLLRELRALAPLGISYREDDYACELAPQHFQLLDSPDVRRATMDDLSAVAEMRRDFECEYFGTRRELLMGDWPFTLAARYIQDGTYVGLQNGEPVSMATREASIPGFTHIGAVYTKPEYRGMGLAHHTVAALCAESLLTGDRITLYVKRENFSAIHVYESLGFERWGNYTMCVLQQ